MVRRLVKRTEGPSCYSYTDCAGGPHERLLRLLRCSETSTVELPIDAESLHRAAPLAAREAARLRLGEARFRQRMMDAQLLDFALPASTRSSHEQGTLHG